MPAQVLLETELNIDYSQFYILSDPENGAPDMAEAMKGQVNGLCHAATEGSMSMVTGINLGPTTLRVELHRDEPPLDDCWEDVVEVSFRATTDHAAVEEWGGGGHRLDLSAGQYRVRYSGRNMDEAHNVGTTDKPIDAYLLQIWPGAAAPDRIIRRTSENAAYWHKEAETHRKPKASRRHAINSTQDIRRI